MHQARTGIELPEQNKGKGVEQEEDGREREGIRGYRKRGRRGSRAICETGPEAAGGAGTSMEQAV